MEQKRSERQTERWNAWRQTDFDELLRLYTRVTHDFALSNFSMRNIEDVNELAMDSSFLLDELRNRYYLKEDRLSPFL